MKQLLARPGISWILLIFMAVCSCSENQMKVSSFCESLEPVQRILEDPDWTNWDMAPIYDEEGRIHLYVGRWPRDGNWLKNAQIVHTVSDRPEGPYEVLDTVFINDTISYYNPQINKVGDLYVMVYAYKEQSFPNINQKVGLATSASLDGPWKPSPHNPILAPSYESGTFDCLHASNPSFHVDKEGKFRIYYKSVSDQPEPYLRTISLAISDQIEGPYEPHPDNPLISYEKYGLDVEDPYNFIYDGKYYMILEDRMDVASTYTGIPADPDTVRPGGWRPGLIYESDDGVNWDEPEIGYRTNAFYFDEPVRRFERPHILWKEGEPEYLFMSLAGGKYGLGTGAVLKINNWKKPAQAGDNRIALPYPEWSWEKVPVYIHFGKRDVLTEAEIEFVATHSNLACFEKGHGINVHGSSDKGIEADAARLKKVNPDLKVIYYWNTFLDYNMYDAHQVYEEHPEWWLKKLDGTLDKKRGDIKRYDLSNAEVREWWTDEVKKAVIDGSCDGVFMDAFPQIASPANIKLWGQEKYDSIQEGLLKNIELTREKIGPDNIIMYNGIRNTNKLHFGMQYVDQTDAATIEHFDQFFSREKENVALDLENMIEAGKKGKMVIMKAWPGFNWTEKEIRDIPYEELLQQARDSITFPLACFLIAAQPHSYFCYSWGYRDRHGSLAWYPEFDKPIGEPKGQAVREGWIFSRKFEHCEVWIDVEHKRAKIDWKQ